MRVWFLIFRKFPMGFFQCVLCVSIKKNLLFHTLHTMFISGFFSCQLNKFNANFVVNYNICPLCVEFVCILQRTKENKQNRTFEQCSSILFAWTFHSKFYNTQSIESISSFVVVFFVFFIIVSKCTFYIR